MSSGSATWTTPPRRTTDNPEVKQLKTILGGLASLTKGLAELRNQVGVGHGREIVPTWIRPRHARLAAGAALVWCQLMLETLDDPDAPWRALAQDPGRPRLALSHQRSRLVLAQADRQPAAAATAARSRC